MRIMLDTNILITTGLFPNITVNHFIEYIVSEHELVLSDLVIKEFIEVAGYEKFNRVSAAQEFLKKLKYYEFKTPDVKPIEGVSIRDDNDYPILFSAITAGVDLFITGDKDFLECSVDSPKIMTMAQFGKEFISS